jgi:hypothetical protein
MHFLVAAPSPPKAGGTVTDDLSKSRFRQAKKPLTIQRRLSRIGNSSQNISALSANDAPVHSDGEEAPLRDFEHRKRGRVIAELHNTNAKNQPVKLHGFR